MADTRQNFPSLLAFAAGLPPDVSSLIRLDKFALNAAIRLCAKTGRWHFAGILLEIMRAERVEIDIIALTTVAASCSRPDFLKRDALLGL